MAALYNTYTTAATVHTCICRWGKWCDQVGSAPCNLQGGNQICSQYWLDMSPPCAQEQMQTIVLVYIYTYVWRWHRYIALPNNKDHRQNVPKWCWRQFFLAYWSSVPQGQGGELAWPYSVSLTVYYCSPPSPDLDEWWECACPFDSAIYQGHVYTCTYNGIKLCRGSTFTQGLTVTSRYTHIYVHIPVYTI